MILAASGNKPTYKPEGLPSQMYRIANQRAQEGGKGATLTCRTKAAEDGQVLDHLPLRQS